jgi:hypothetical protein
MAKLEGEAEVRDGVLEVKLHNGSEWELKEIVVGVTLLNQPIAGLQPARLVNATELQPETKPPDVTTLYHLKATAPADAIMMFRAVVNDELSQAKDWHWALVSARGIPPAAPVSTPVPQNSLLQQSVISAPLAQETAPGAQSQVPTPTSTAVQPVVDLPIQH